jgi:hypothetical protein
MVLSSDLEDLAAAWVRYATDRENESGQAWERTRELAEREPDMAWQLALALIERVPDDLLDHVAANLLEHILEHHAERFLVRVKEQASKDGRFRTCLGWVWLVDDDAPGEILRQLRAASGNRLDIIPRAELDEIESKFGRGGA